MLIVSQTGAGMQGWVAMRYTRDFQSKKVIFTHIFAP